ncbi:MAG: hydrogenase maturation protease [Acidobacteria bacterium]|nr:hydrogenase maturation protease [Acidobacteriota bacterium]
MKSIVIGIGNRDRGDDAVGIIVAGRLREIEALPARVLELAGEGATLIDAWQGYDRAILVDAIRPGAKPGMEGAIHWFDGHETVLPSGLFHYSTHAFSVAEAVEMARVLGLLPPVLLVCGVVGKSFAPGLSLSPMVEQAARTLTADLARLLMSEHKPQ